MYRSILLDDTPNDSASKAQIIASFNLVNVGIQIQGKKKIYGLPARGHPRHTDAPP